MRISIYPGNDSRKQFISDLYLMISLKHNFLFIHIPKTAGNSVQNVLREYSEDKVVCLNPLQDGIERFGVISERFRTQKHSTIKDYQVALGNELLANMYKFTTVRNPWDRMISSYFSPHRGDISWNRDQFKKLIFEVAPVSAYISIDPSATRILQSLENIDYFIRYERLNDDFKKVCEMIGITWEPLAIRNKSERQSYHKYYDDELIELVRNSFQDEIEYFNYEYQDND